MKAKDFKSDKEARKAAVKQLEFYNRMMTEKIANKSKGEKMPKPKKKLFIVDTISTFRNRYIIEADELEHAYDEVTMVDSGDPDDSFESAEQRYLGETILDGREITIEDFDDMIVKMEETNEGSHWMGEKLIRKINYGR